MEVPALAPGYLGKTSLQNFPRVDKSDNTKASLRFLEDLSKSTFLNLSIKEYILGSWETSIQNALQKNLPEQYKDFLGGEEDQTWFEL